MQLRLAALTACCGWLLSAGAARATAQPQLAAGASVFHEAGGPLKMTVITPEVDADVPLGDRWAITADWSADVVSGASVQVVDAPALSVDAIGSASVSDVRHLFGAGLKLHDGQSSLSARYHYGFENDYRSHGIDVRARTDLYERNTSLEVAYARAFDSVCDGPDASEPVLKGRLVSSEGCFGGGAEVRERDLDVHTFQAAWTQAWTPVLASQLTGTAQIVHGFQSNPYRAVLIGRTAAQEHHPENRARYALGLGLRLWLRPFSGALQPQLRVYRDTWDVLSWTGELAYEQSLGYGLRLRGRARYYAQGAAAFYSDDYVLQPRGRYFTGDRELSPMHSMLVGGQLAWVVPADAQGDILGLLSGLEVALKLDLLRSAFEQFHYDRVEVPNDDALLAALTLLGGF